MKQQPISHHRASRKRRATTRSPTSCATRRCNPPGIPTTMPATLGGPVVIPKLDQRPEQAVLLFQLRWIRRPQDHRNHLQPHGPDAAAAAGRFLRSAADQRRPSIRSTTRSPSAPIRPGPATTCAIRSPATHPEKPDHQSGQPDLLQVPALPNNPPAQHQSGTAEQLSRIRPSPTTGATSRLPIASTTSSPRSIASSAAGRG